MFCQQADTDPCEGILQEVLNHPGPEALAHYGQDSEKRAVPGHNQQAFDSLVQMRYAEEEGLRCNGGGVAASEGQKLLLQIAAKHEFLAESR